MLFKPIYISRLLRDACTLKRLMRIGEPKEDLQPDSRAACWDAELRIGGNRVVGRGERSDFDFVKLAMSHYFCEGKRLRVRSVDGFSQALGENRPTRL